MTRVGAICASVFSGMVAFATIGCWAARPGAVATPEFTSVRTRLEAADALRADARLAQLPADAESNNASGQWLPSASPRPWRYIVLHHSGTSAGSVESIDAEHRRRTDDEGRPWLGIGYHFVVGNGRDMEDGQIVPTFRWDRQLAGAHAGAAEYNAAGIGICVIGDCDADPPTSEQLKSLHQLVSMLSRRYAIGPTAVVPHSGVKATRCPGRLFPFDDIANSAMAPPVGEISWRRDRQRRGLAPGLVQRRALDAAHPDATKMTGPGLLAHRVNPTPHASTGYE